MKLFIANIPHQLTEPELNQLLTQYGQVISIKLPIDLENGKRKGFGFIEMRDPSQAQKAIEGLNGMEIHGRKLSIKEAIDKNAPSYNKQYQPKRQRIGQETNNNSGEIDGNRW